MEIDIVIQNLKDMLINRGDNIDEFEDNCTIILYIFRD